MQVDQTTYWLLANCSTKVIAICQFVKRLTSVETVGQKTMGRERVQ